MRCVLDKMVVNNFWASEQTNKNRVSLGGSSKVLSRAFPDDKFSDSGFQIMTTLKGASKGLRLILPKSLRVSSTGIFPCLFPSAPIAASHSGSTRKRPPVMKLRHSGRKASDSASLIFLVVTLGNR